MQPSIFSKPQGREAVPAIGTTVQQQPRNLNLVLHTRINVHTVDVGRVEVPPEAASHMRQLDHVEDEEGLVLAMHDVLRLESSPPEARLPTTSKFRWLGSLKPLAISGLSTVAFALW